MPLLDLSVTEGEDAILECGIYGHPVPDVSWRKNGIVIGHMLDFKQSYESGIARLVISKSCTQDYGKYSCVATSQKGEVSTSCQLTVTGWQ